MRRMPARSAASSSTTITVALALAASLPFRVSGIMRARPGSCRHTGGNSRRGPIDRAAPLDDILVDGKGLLDHLPDRKVLFPPDAAFTSHLLPEPGRAQQSPQSVAQHRHVPSGYQIS